MEVEAKYRVTGSVDPAQLESVDLSPYRLTFAALLDLQDTVYDTEDQALARAGQALRVRRDGERTLVTLKSGGTVDGAVHSRDEVEIAWSDEHLARSDWPESIAARVRPHAPLDALRPLVSVENRRSAWSVLNGAEEIAELAFDEGAVRAAGLEEPFREIEVELRHGTREDLNSITDRLAASLPLEPESRSKSSRGRALLDRRRGEPEASGMVSEDGAPAGRSGAGPSEPSRWPFASARSALEALLAAEVEANPTILATAAIEAEAPEVDEGLPASSPAGSQFGARPESRGREHPAAAPEQEPAEASSRQSPAETESPSPGGDSDQENQESNAEKAPAELTLREAAAGIVGRNLEKLLAAEPVAREGLDVEGVHDMRVATRRMRAAFQVLVENGQSVRSARRFHDRLSDLARTLGAVRDSDVLLEALEAYATDHPPAEVAGLGPLRAELELQRAKGRKQMLATLNQRRTQRLFQRIERWCGRSAKKGDSSAPEPQPTLVRHFVHTAVWRRYEEILAYETVMPAPVPLLHRLRIAGKRLRYTLEFFEDAMGPETRGLLKDLAATQDRLGLLQDAEVAIGLIDDLARKRQGTAALQSYRDYCRARQEELAQAFAEDWQTLSGRDFRRRLGDLVTPL